VDCTDGVFPLPFPRPAFLTRVIFLRLTDSLSFRSRPPCPLFPGSLWPPPRGASFPHHPCLFFERCPDQVVSALSFKPWHLRMFRVLVGFFFFFVGFFFFGGFFFFFFFVLYGVGGGGVGVCVFFFVGVVSDSSLLYSTRAAIKRVVSAPPPLPYSNLFPPPSHDRHSSFASWIPELPRAPQRRVIHCVPASPHVLQAAFPAPPLFFAVWPPTNRRARRPLENLFSPQM